MSWARTRVRVRSDGAGGGGPGPARRCGRRCSRALRRRHRPLLLCRQRVAAAGPGVSPLPDTPAVSRAAVGVPAAPVPLAPAAIAKPEAPAAKPVGKMQVQLAAVDSEEAAKAEWQRLAKRMPELLGERRPSFQRAERDGKAVWRVRTGGFADTAGGDRVLWEAARQGRKLHDCQLLGCWLGERWSRAGSELRRACYER